MSGFQHVISSFDTLQVTAHILSRLSFLDGLRFDLKPTHLINLYKTISDTIFINAQSVKVSERWVVDYLYDVATISELNTLLNSELGHLHGDLLDSFKLGFCCQKKFGLLISPLAEHRLAYPERNEVSEIQSIRNSISNQWWKQFGIKVSGAQYALEASLPTSHEQHKLIYQFAANYIQSKQLSLCYGYVDFPDRCIWGNLLRTCSDEIWYLLNRCRLIQKWNFSDLQVLNEIVARHHTLSSRGQLLNEFAGTEVMKELPCDILYGDVCEHLRSPDLTLEDFKSLAVKIESQAGSNEKALSVLKGFCVSLNKEPFLVWG